MEDQGIEKAVEYLCSEEGNVGRFCLLPKIQRFTLNGVKGRPVKSNCVTFT